MLQYSLPCKVKGSFPIFRVQVIEHLHQLIAPDSWRILIKQVELSHPLAEEIAEHNAGFLIPVPTLPDFVQALYRGVDNVAAILRWREQLH